MIAAVDNGEGVGTADADGLGVSGVGIGAGATVEVGSALLFGESWSATADNI